MKADWNGFDSQLAAAEFFADRAATYLADAETADDDSAAAVHDVPRYLAKSEAYARLADVSLGLHAAGADRPWFGESHFSGRSTGGAGA